MRAIESFELTLSEGDAFSSGSAVAENPFSQADPTSGVHPASEAVRLLLTFDDADRLHLPQAIVSAQFDPTSHRFVVLFEDDAHREEVAFPVEFINPDDGRPDQEARADVANMVGHFDRIVVIGLSSSGLSSASSAPAAARPDLKALSPSIVVFGDVPLAVGPVAS
jgi:hypothetical protein